MMIPTDNPTPTIRIGQVWEARDPRTARPKLGQRRITIVARPTLSSPGVARVTAGTNKGELRSFTRRKLHTHYRLIRDVR